ncbi:MAG: hypothetical protein WBH97_08395 [Rectinemataceae bacterium]
MKSAKVFAMCFALAISAVAAGAQTQAQAQPEVSEKQDIAVFALGYYGWDIPGQALGSIDTEVQKVFVDLGRFNVFGVEQRLSSGGLNQFIATLREVKSQTMTLPDKFIFGEAFLTQAEFNSLAGAFVVAVPVVTWFQTVYNTKTLQWETDITTSVTMIDVAEGGQILAIKSLKTSGSDKNDYMKSVRSAISGIPFQLEYEIRTIPQFQIKTRVLSVSGDGIRFQLGQDIGIRKGDEFALMGTENIGGILEERESGLVVVREVGQSSSFGQILYSETEPGMNTALREIPRQGVDMDLFLHVVSGNDGAVLPGLRMALSRGYYGLRPYVAVQVPLQQIFSAFTVTILPVNVILGGEYNLLFGRFGLTPYAGLGFTYIHLSEAISGITTDTDFLSHVGGQAQMKLSYLFNRNMRAFVDIGYEYWAAVSAIPGLFEDINGTSVGAGILFKL